MSINAEDRPIESVREEVVDALIYNYSHGHINEKAFERRLDVAMESQDPHKIIAQSADLEIPEASVVKNYDMPKPGVQFASDQEADSENIVCIFGGTDRKGPWIVPEHINAVFVFGGGSIDLSQAIFTSKTVTIKVFCLFGGGDIAVPEGMQVSASTICIFGGVDNKVNSVPDSDNPVLRVEGFVMFGGLDIKIKQTLKEKFVVFANQMKAMFNTK